MGCWSYFSWGCRIIWVYNKCIFLSSKFWIPNTSGLQQFGEWRVNQQGAYSVRHWLSASNMGAHWIFPSVRGDISNPILQVMKYHRQLWISFGKWNSQAKEYICIPHWWILVPLKYLAHYKAKKKLYNAESWQTSP